MHRAGQGRPEQLQKGKSGNCLEASCRWSWLQLHIFKCPLEAVTIGT